MANQIVPQKAPAISMGFTAEKTTVGFMDTDGTVTIKKLSEIAADDPVQKRISKYAWKVNGDGFIF